MGMRRKLRRFPLPLLSPLPSPPFSLSFSLASIRFESFAGGKKRKEGVGGMDRERPESSKDSAVAPAKLQESTWQWGCGVIGVQRFGAVCRNHANGHLKGRPSGQTLVANKQNEP